MNNPQEPLGRDFEKLKKSEQARLRTFYGHHTPWPNLFISPKDCAKAGFFFVGDADKVQCTFCQGVIGEWQIGDIPMIEHKKHFPKCPFVCNLPVGNLAIVCSELPTSNQQDTALGIDVCGHSNRSVSAHACLDRGIKSPKGEKDEIKSAVIETTGGPAMKKFVSVQSRLQTFKNWPVTARQTAEEMAEAGFYFTGVRDQANCFYCGGGFMNWESCDDPWEEHARWFSKCPYLLLRNSQLLKKPVKTKRNDTPANCVLNVPEKNHILPGESTEGAIEEASSNCDDKHSIKFLQNSSVDNCACSSYNKSRTSSQIANIVVDLSITKTPSPEPEYSNDFTRGICPSSLTERSGNEVMQKRKDMKDFPLEEEIRKLREARQCKICMDSEVEVVFLPCGHLVTCISCATVFSECALCRQQISAVVRTYLS